MRLSRSATIGLILTALSATALVPARAWALDREVKSVLVAGGYGMVLGTMAGALSVPFTRNARTMFVGTSLGLYLGLVIGIYYVLDKDNPLRLKPGERQGGSDPRLLDQELRSVASVRASHQMDARAAGDQLTRVDVAVLRF
jgi:hypothetical protein